MVPIWPESSRHARAGKRIVQIRSWPAIVRQVFFTSRYNHFWKQGQIQPGQNQEANPHTSRADSVLQGVFQWQCPDMLYIFRSYSGWRKCLRGMGDYKKPFSISRYFSQEMNVILGSLIFSSLKKLWLYNVSWALLRQWDPLKIKSLTGVLPEMRKFDRVQERL